MAALDAATDNLPSFRLQAERVEAEWTQSDAYAIDPTTGLFFAAFPTTSGETLHGVDLVSTTSRDGWFAYVFPLNSALASWSCGGSVQASDDENIVAINQVDGQRPTWDASTASTLHARSCDGAVRIDGDMRITFWQFDGTLTSNQKSGTFETGLSPTNPDARPALQRARQAYLTVYDGHLEFSGVGDLYLSNLELHDAATIEVAGAQPLLGDAGELAGDQLALKGTMGAEVHREGRALRVVVADGLDAINGHAVDAPGTAALPSTLLVWSMAGLAPAWIAIRWLRQDHSERAFRLHARGLNRRALVHAKFASRFQRSNVESLETYGQICENLGQIERACELYQRAFDESDLRPHRIVLERKLATLRGYLGRRP